MYLLLKLTIYIYLLFPLINNVQATEIDDIKAGSMHLSLKDTIFRTLENNLTIAVEDFNSKV